MLKISNYQYKRELLSKIVNEQSSIIICKKYQINNFYSSHPFSMKKNLAYNFIQKVFKLSDVEKKECEIKITKLLKQNNYPPKIIRRLINQHKFNYRHTKHFMTRFTIFEQKIMISTKNSGHRQNLNF